MVTKQEFDANYQKAYQNDSAAQYIVGKYYLEHNDPWNAKNWLTKSADQQNFDGCY